MLAKTGQVFIATHSRGTNCQVNVNKCSSVFHC